MPLYEYKCQKCNQQFEELIFGNTQPNCPSCKSPAVERLLSVVSVGSSKPDVPPSPCGSCPGGGSCGLN